MVTSQLLPLLGMVDQDKVVISSIGRIVQDLWLWLARQYSYVELYEYCIMPNHLHGIIWIINDQPEAAVKSIGRLIGAFKTVSTKWVNRYRGTPTAPLWQRDFYDHVIRSEEELQRIRQYILDYSIRWATDRENPLSRRHS